MSPLTQSHCFNNYYCSGFQYTEIDVFQAFVSWIVAVTNALRALTLTPPNSYLTDYYSYQVIHCCDREREQQLPVGYHPTSWLL